MSRPTLAVFQGVVADRFAEKFSRASDSECWPWLAALTRRGGGGPGYGVIRACGVMYRASQVAWCLANGSDWPEGMHAMHSCDNPSCVNPAHIRPGTHAENMRDMFAKGRRPPPNGIVNGKALPNEVVAQIRAQRSAGVPMRRIASELGVSLSGVRNICSGRNRSAA